MKLDLNPAAKKSLDKKLVRYALVGSALLGVPEAGHAGIVYSGPITFNIGPNTTGSIDINGLTTSTSALPGADFTLTVGPFGVPSFVNVSGPGTTFFDAGLAPLQAGASITAANTNALPGQLMSSSKINLTRSYAGPWANLPSSAYLGIQFDIGGQEHLGWAQLSILQGNPFVQVQGYAYNDVAGAPINAGDSGAVPETNSLLMFATGAAGILALRRRKSA